MIQHCFTVDVEEAFQVSAFEGAVGRADWHQYEARVERNVGRLLDILARHEARGTFFVLGWIGERYPRLIREIAQAGNEIASHGQDHRRVTQETPEQFRESVRRSKAVLEDAAAQRIVGFRAPSFSIVPGLEWAFDVLLEEGYCYDSSLFPIRRPGGYGYPAAPPNPHWIERDGGRLYELPLTTLRRVGWNFPASGGAYFRLFPYRLTRAAFRSCTDRGESGVFYIHPWEVDPEQPRIAAPFTARLRHYSGLRRTQERLHRLLTDFEFGPVRDHLQRSGIDCPQ